MTLLLWLGVRPGGHQRGAGAVSGAVVLEGFICSEAEETRWSGLGNRTVRFGGCHKLVLAPVLVSTFTSEILFCSTSTSGIFSTSGFALPSAEDFLLDPVLP
jgi:hypothetical protein